MVLEEQANQLADGVYSLFLNVVLDTEDAEEDVVVGIVFTAVVHLELAQPVGISQALLVRQPLEVKPSARAKNSNVLGSSSSS